MSAWEELFTANSVGLSEERFVQFQADFVAFRDLYRDRDLFQFRLGDRFNELQARWDEKVALVTSAACVPRRSILQWARVAEQIPPDSPLRATKLPYSILRLLAPLPEPYRERWAAEAVKLRDRKELRPREFAQRLEEAGLRQPRQRAPRPAPCLYCGKETGASPERIEWREEGKAGWTCGRRCLIAYLQRLERQRPSGARPDVVPSPSPGRETPRLPGGDETVETQSLNLVRESQSGKRDPKPEGVSQSGVADREKAGVSQSEPPDRASAPVSQSQPSERESARESQSGTPVREGVRESQEECEAARESQREQRIYMRGRFIGVWKSRPRWGGGSRPGTRPRRSHPRRSPQARGTLRPGSTPRRPPSRNRRSRSNSVPARAPPAGACLAGPRQASRGGDRRERKNAKGSETRRKAQGSLTGCTGWAG